MVLLLSAGVCEMALGCLTICVSISWVICDCDIVDCFFDFCVDLDIDSSGLPVCVDARCDLCRSATWTALAVLGPPG